MALDLDNILVFNRNECIICVEGPNNESFRFKAATEDEPSVNIMTLKALQFVNSNTKIIKTGWLTFEDEYKEEIYTQLRIKDWDKIMSNEEIREILLAHTMEGLQRLIDINDFTYFDRVRIELFRLIQDGADVTSRVRDIVDRRYAELQARQRKSSIVLVPKDTVAPMSKVKKLETQNEELQAQIAEMKAMMEKMMKTSQAGEADTPTEESAPTKKTRGRPKKVGD